MKVLEKAGYHLEATHKKAVLKNNVIMDEYLYVKMAN
jgi:RimJ/RimL family protein N-acetyltransferase